MTDEQIEKITSAIRNLQYSLIINVGLGLVIAIGLGTMSIVLAINNLASKIGPTP